MKTRTLWLSGLMLAVALTAWVRGATVTATVDPTDISLGDSTQLTVTVSGGASQPTVPKVDGLEIIGVGESTQMEIVNGVVTQNSSRTYSITPQRAGTFTIPALQSGDAKSQSITLNVAAGPGGVTQAQAAQGPQQPPQIPSGQGPVVMPPPGANPAPQPGTGPIEQGKYGSIEVKLPKKQFYDGELEPVEIKVLISAEVEIDSVDAPQFTSDGFTLNTLGKPEQSSEMINGHPYHVLVWSSALTAVKPGDFSINLTMPITVIVRQQMPDLNDPDQIDNFMRNAFAAMQGVRKHVNLAGATESLKVLPLPQAGRPADFNGAVGFFEAETSANPVRVNAGDPITLKLAVTGHGNFDRVSSDMLPNDANWRTYHSSQPKFEAQDGVGYAGTKTFEQAIVPNNGSVKEIPPLSFSYFDPEKGQYATCTTPPIPISVAGAPAAPAPAANAAVASSNPSPVTPAPVPIGPELRMNQIEPGSFVSTLEPIYLNPLFLGGQAVPLVALLGGLAFLRRRRSALEPERLRLSAAQQAIRQQVAAMDAAMQDQQAGPFFVHARNALQQRFGQQWNMRPEAITVADLDARLGEQGANARTVFEMADQATYSDLQVGDADLHQWRQVVVDELAEAKR
jgi:hypothetical protein